MNKKKSILVLGIMLLILTISFAANNSKILFSNMYKDGETIIHLNSVNEGDIDAIKAIIIENTTINENDIRIKTVNGELNINFDLVELDVIKAIESDLKNQSLEIIGYESFGKSSNEPGLYILYFLLASTFLTGAILVTTSLISISKDKISQ